MDDWKSVLRADPTDWLLEGDDPSVRYFALTDILGRPESAPEVKEVKAQIMESGPVSRILARQTDEGYWGVREDFYIRAKYRGTVGRSQLSPSSGQGEGMNGSGKRPSSFSGTPRTAPAAVSPIAGVGEEEASTVP